MECAVRTGSVLFSTTIFGPFDTRAMCRAASSQFFRFAARPAPTPCVFVGVFTDTNMISHSRIAASMSVVKNKFTPRDFST